MWSPAREEGGTGSRGGHREGMRLLVSGAHRASQLQHCCGPYKTRQPARMDQIGLWFASLIISALWPLNLLTSFLPHPTFDIHSHGSDFSLPKTATIPHKFNSKCPLSYTTSYIPTTFTLVLQHQQFFNSPILAIHLFLPSFHCITIS